MEHHLQKLNQGNNSLANIQTISGEESWKVRSEIDLPANVSLAVVRSMDPHQTSSLVKKNPDGTVDKTECYKYIKLAVLDIITFFGSSLTDYQLLEISKLLYQKFWYWRLLDWKNFKEKVCGLSYGKEHGKVFGFVNAGHIMEWANNYDAEWSESVDSEMMAQHDQYKKGYERERDMQEKIEQEKEKRIHISAVEDFKKRVKYPEPEESFQPNIETPSPQTNIEEK